jgi:probable rRNA maturation factor
MKQKRPAPSRSHRESAVENRQKAVRVELRSLEEFLESVLSHLRLAHGCAAVRLIDDREMLRLNRTFRKKPKTTDVLSFPVEERATPRSLPARLKHVRGKYLGDIAISPVVARRNAAALERALSDELRILILHGVLHLLGYDHESDRGQMDFIENRLRRELGLA